MSAGRSVSVGRSAGPCCAWRHRRSAQSEVPPQPSVPRLSAWQPVLASAADFRALPRASSSRRLCIALLCRGVARSCVAAFARYHRLIGVEAIFLYLDDPLEAAELRLDELHTELDGDFLRVTLCTAEFWSARLASSAMVARRNEHAVFDDAARCWRDEAQSRQVLCVEDAIERASRAGLDWLLHIDADEALLPQRTHPADFFALLPEHVEQVFFANLEGVPPTMDTANWMAELRDFKINPSCGERKRIDAMWRAHLHSRAGSGEPSVPSSYFTAYASGKSAIRLALPRTQRLAVPFDVHKFLVPAGDGLWRAPTTLTCAEALELADAPVVLHYANAGFA